MNSPQLVTGWVTYLPLVSVVLATLLGLIPLAITLRTSARNILLAEARKMEQERRNIISALLAELKRFNERLDVLDKSGKDHPIRTWNISSLQNAGIIFEKYLSQLGSLNPNTIGAVSQAYEDVRSLPAYLVKVGKAVKDPENPLFLDVDVEYCRHLLEYPIKSTRKAIDSLEHELAAI